MILVLPLSVCALRHAMKVVEMIVIGEMEGPVVVMVDVIGVVVLVIIAVSVIVVQVFMVAGDVIHPVMQAVPFSPAAQGTSMSDKIAKFAKLGNLQLSEPPPVSIVRQASLPMLQEAPPASTVRQGHTSTQKATMRCLIASTARHRHIPP
jgi:hypothetical protein